MVLHARAKSQSQLGEGEKEGRRERKTRTMSKPLNSASVARGGRPETRR